MKSQEKEMKKLHISMSYIFVGDVEVDIPVELLKGKSDEEQLQIAEKYVRDHISEIPVAENAEYIADSDDFESEDINWVSNDMEEELDENDFDM